MSNSIEIIGLKYDGHNLEFEYKISYNGYITSHISNYLYNYKYNHTHDLSPFSIESDDFEINFNSTSMYDISSTIEIIDKRNGTNIELSISTEDIEIIRDHILENRRLHYNQRSDYSSQQNNEENDFEQYNINQVLNTGRPISQNNIDPLNNQDNNPGNINNYQENVLDNTNNNPTGGMRKTKKKQRNHKRKTRMRKIKKRV